MAHIASEEKIGEYGALRLAPNFKDNTRYIVGIILMMVSIRAAMKLGGYLFGIADINDSLSIFGFSLVVFIFIHALANRKRAEKQSGAVFSLSVFVITIFITISLCALARVVPFLRS